MSSYKHASIEHENLENYRNLENLFHSSSIHLSRRKKVNPSAIDSRYLIIFYSFVSKCLSVEEIFSVIIDSNENADRYVWRYIDEI